MNNISKENILLFKDELHARPYIKLGNNLRTFHFGYLIDEDDEDRAWKHLDKYLNKLGAQGYQMKNQNLGSRR